MKAKNVDKIMKEFASITIIFFIMIVPFLSNAQGLIPTDCGNLQANGTVDRECGYTDLIKLIDNVINWIIIISVPVAAGVIAWAGFKLMTTGAVDQKSAAKSMIRKVLIGFVFILAAWVIVSTILDALLNSDIRGNIRIN